jgi:glutamate-1-semialdehyde 2,1-aminomutase
MIGGGFPIGAIGGRAEVMEVLNPRAKKVLFPHSGTFSANPISTTAGLVALERFDAAAVAHLNTLAKRALLGIEDAIRTTGARACVTGGGSMIRVHIKEHVPHNYREAFLAPEERYRLKLLLDHLFDAGFMMINTCAACLSTPMTETEIDALVGAFATGFEKITETG